MMATSATPRSGLALTRALCSLNATNNRRSKNERWMRISTPNTGPAGMDQFLICFRNLIRLDVSLCPGVARRCDVADRSSGFCLTMRIIAGKFRSRPLRSLRGLDIRPTSDRLRETLFNILTAGNRSEEHTSELQSHLNLVCRLLLEKKNT